MRLLWSIIVIASAMANAVWVGISWHDGIPPNGFVWISSIAFSVGVIIDHLENIFAIPSEEGRDA